MKSHQREERRVAVVTGGARGLGAAITARLLKDGMRVAVFARDPSALSALKVAGADSILKLKVDVTRPKQVSVAVDDVKRRYGRIDVLVNNAGVSGPIGPIQDVAVKEWNDAIAVNLTGAFLCCKHAVPLMLKAQRGSIINISSMVAKKAVPYRAAYAASKSGLVGLTRSLSRELGRFGITVNAVSPGPIEGERMKEVIRSSATASKTDPEAVRRRLLEASSLRRFSTSGEVAGLVSFLASPAASAITGQDFNVDAT